MLLQQRGAAAAAEATHIPMTTLRGSALPLVRILLFAAAVTVGLVPTCNSFTASSTSTLPHRRSAARSICNRPCRPSAFPAAAAASSSSFFDELSSRFQGDFDNYDQVLCDRRDNLLPREGGGHENIHCTLVPVAVQPILSHVRSDTRQARLAAFYFDGLPDRIFRFRLYSLWSRDEDDDGNTSRSGNGSATQNAEEAASAKTTATETATTMTPCGMTLYSLSAETEGMLRGLSGRPVEWGAALERYLSSISPTEPFRELSGCDVEWTPDPDPDRHAYAYGTSSRLHPDDAHHAVMVNGEATIPSMMNPGSLIRVVDELSLWSDDFWINDRGFDPDTGNFIYGNQKGVPYKMKRVASLVGVGTKQERRIDNEELAWTLGDEFRSVEQYKENMDAIGGMSTVLNAPSKSKKEA